MNKALSLLALATLAFAAPALAKDDTVATLATQTGQISASREGGEFIATAQGQRLQTDDRLMLVEGATATVRFDNGCELEFKRAGVYSIPRDCAAGIVDWRGAATIAAGVGVAAALLDSMDNIPPPPVSR